MHSSDQLQILIVGAGHYAKNLITPKYLLDTRFKIQAVVSHSASETSLMNTHLKGVIVFKNVCNWAKITPLATRETIIADLCVHSNLVVELISTLCELGVRNFILPKPVAITKEDIGTIIDLQNRYNLKIAIASQWFYSDMVDTIKNKLSINIKNIEAKLNFCQMFTLPQRERYSVLTALLPHMLQIIHSTNLCNLSELHELQVLNYSPVNLNINIKPGTASFGKNIFMSTGIASDIKERSLIVYQSENNERSVLAADFLGFFDPNGKEVHKLKIENQMEKNIIEDNLQSMTNCHYNYWRMNSNSEKILSFDKYLPIALEQIKIQEIINNG